MRISLISSNILKTYLKGFIMGCADIVPGVSGGTMALVLGIYPKLIFEVSKLDQHFLKDLITLKIKKILNTFDFSFLIPLLIGIFSAIILGAFFIHWLLELYPEATWGFFLGLMIASCIVVRKRIEKFNRPLLFSCILASLYIVNMVPFKTADNYGLYFLSGMIAIIAMILPGISGAFLLLVMGKYEQVTGALKAPFTDSNTFILFVFCLGCLIGLVSFSKVLKKALNNYPDYTYSGLLGFIIGALYKLWPWKRILESEVIRGKEIVLQTENMLPKIWASYDFLVILLIIAGIFLVLLIEKMSSRGVSSAG